MKNKESGFTTVELITSFSLASVVMLVLFNVIIIMKDNLSEVNTKTNMLVEKDNLSYNINKRLKEKELSSITTCEDSDKCYLFSYNDDTSDKLVYSNTNKTITFNNYTFDIIDGITVEEPTITEHYDTMSSTTYNGYFIINIPITFNNKDYSIEVLRHFNIDNLFVDLGNYYRDNENNLYTKVEYLESTGTEYVNTEYKPNQNTKLEIDGNITGSAGMSIFGSNPYFVVSSSSATNNYLFRYNNIRFDTNFSIFNRAFIMLDKTGGYINNDLYQAWDDVEFQSPYNVLLFARNSSSGSVEENSQSRIYSCKIYESGVLVRDYIPVLDSTNTPCLFDKIEKKCYYNEGEGEFYYPNFETNSEYGYQKIHYIQSIGTQYIDTGYKPNQNTKIEIDGNITMGSAGMSIFGSNPYFVVTSRSKTRNYLFRYNNTLGETDFQVSTRCNIMLDKTGGYINNNLYQSWDDVEFQSPYNILLFARNSSSGSAEEKSQSRIYSCKIYESGVLVRDYIPILDSSDTPCLFDKVSKECYYNQGTGEFLWG